MSEIIPNDPTTTTTTTTMLASPAKVYDDTHEKMVRVPVQFPDPPLPALNLPNTVYQVGNINISDNAESYTAPNFNFLSLGGANVRSDVKIKLSTENFHPITGMLILSFSYNEAVNPEPKVILLFNSQQVDVLPQVGINHAVVVRTDDGVFQNLKVISTTVSRY